MFIRKVHNIYKPRLPNTPEEFILHALSFSEYRNHKVHITIENSIDGVLFRGFGITIGLKLSEGNEVDVQYGQALCYKYEGRWFDLSWCHWNFSLTLNPSVRTMDLRSTQLLTKVSNRSISLG